MFCSAQFPFWFQKVWLDRTHRMPKWPLNGCEQSGKSSLSLKLQEWVKDWHICDFMIKDIGDQNKEMGQWNKHLTNIF